MASILKVDTIQDQSGNNIINENADTITIGASGDTITVPTGATLTVPSGGLTGQNYPAFFAHANTGQSVSSSTWTKITLATEVVDTDSAFASDKFTVPSGKDGKYFFQGSLNTYANNDMTRTQVAIYKNGAVLSATYNIITSTDQDLRHFTAEISTIDDASVGDYYEIYGYIVGSTPQFAHDAATPRSTNFLGYRIGD